MSILKCLKGMRQNEIKKIQQDFSLTFPKHFLESYKVITGYQNPN